MSVLTKQGLFETIISYKIKSIFAIATCLPRSGNGEEHRFARNAAQ